MKGNGTKITALYCRLSQDDGNVGDSMSIQSQKAILEKFAREMGKIAYSFYVDDGYSGTNFQRPSFQKMIADIEDGKIDTVITKDLSRLGRNYLESGAYIEVFFPQHHVRYIAVNDGVDSEQNGGFDITPFKNILNEFYSRDISKKVKSGKHIRALEGKFMGTTAPFGYQKDPQDKNHLIVDEVTAPTVRLIYSLALEGYGTNRIGKVLYERKIPKPSYYKQEFFSQHDTGSEDYWYDWKQEVITRIIRNPVYKGGMYVHGTSKPTFKCKGRGYIRRADREVLEDVHDAVVTKEVWQTANDIIDRHTKVKPCTSGYENIFRGLLKCPDCGQTLLIHTDNRNPNRDLLDKTYYQCTTYRKKGANFCTAHRISAGDIENAVKADIDRHAEKAMKNKEKFINNVLRGMNESSMARTEKTKAEIDKLKKRNAELDQMYIRLYEDYSSGKLSEKKFTMMSAHYEQEQETNEEKLTELEKQYQAKSAAALDQRLVNDMLPDNGDSKAAMCVDKAFEIWEQTKEKKSAQLIFCDLSTPKGDGTFNVYEDVKNKLIEKGVPENEIAFIHSANTDTRKAELFGKVRSGQVRFLLGSTQKMGAGTNVQDRLIALHHLDVPWRPSEEERAGRYINKSSKIKAFHSSVTARLAEHYRNLQKKTEYGIWIHQ